MSFVRALVVLHRTYVRLPVRMRLHALVRFLTCPFLRILPAIPAGARSLLEIGGGHGVFARLARDAGIAFAVSVEPDTRKVRVVQSVHSVAGYADAVRGTFDVVALIDVFYTIPLDEWDALLSAAHARLAPGGTLIVKEQDPTARLKNRWNRAQEWFAQKVLGVTMARAFSCEAPGEFVGRLERLGFSSVTWKRIDFGYPHPHVLYVARKAASA